MGELHQSVILRGKKDIRVNALLDSGASKIFINENLIDRLGYTRVNKVYVELGNGKKVLGFTVPIILKVKGREDSVIAIAIKMSEQLVLGHIFFQKNNIILDYSKEKFRFSKKVPMANKRLRL